MVQEPRSTSLQSSILVTFNTSQTVGKLVNIQTSSLEGITAFAPLKNYQSVEIFTPKLKKDTLYLVGSISGNETDGLYDGGTCTAGTNYASFNFWNSYQS